LHFTKEGKPYYINNLVIGHAELKANGNLKTLIPVSGDEIATSWKEFTLKPADNELRRMDWSLELENGHEYRATAIPYSDKLVVLKVEMFEKKKLVGGSQLFISTDKSAAVAGIAPQPTPSDNSAEVRYLEKAAEVAKFALDKGLEANKIAAKSVSDIEIKQRQLEYDKALLEIELAKSGKRTPRESATAVKPDIDQQIKLLEYDLKLAELTVQEKKLEAKRLPNLISLGKALHDDYEISEVAVRKAEVEVQKLQAKLEQLKNMK
jgi:hypothetical protein